MRGSLGVFKNFLSDFVDLSQYLIFETVGIVSGLATGIDYFG
jgi:predicted Rossmann fold nucleotide-binding protein DprA/Smf involved in DNA uptake